jgi:hypothetical protein
VAGCAVEALPSDIRGLVVRSSATEELYRSWRSSYTLASCSFHAGMVVESESDEVQPVGKRGLGTAPARHQGFEALTAASEIERYGHCSQLEWSQGGEGVRVRLRDRRGGRGGGERHVEGSTPVSPQLIERVFILHSWFLNGDESKVDTLYPARQSQWP